MTAIGIEKDAIAGAATATVSEKGARAGAVTATVIGKGARAGAVIGSEKDETSARGAKAVSTARCEAPLKLTTANDVESVAGSGAKNASQSVKNGKRARVDRHCARQRQSST